MGKNILISAGALFSTGEIYINDSLISMAGSNYAYRAYIESLLNYSPEAKQGWLTSEMYYQDSPGAFNSVSKSDQPYNQGMILRRELTQTSHGFDLFFKPHLELFNQERMLLPCDVRLKFGRNPATFYLMNKSPDKPYKVIINEATMYLRTLKFKDHFEKKLLKSVEEAGGATYPMLRTHVTNFNIPSGTKSFTYPVAKLGKQAVRVFLAFIDQDAFNGDFAQNPFNFQPLSLTYAVFVLNGKQYPSTPLKLTWDSAVSGEFLRAFNELQRTTGVLQSNGGWNVDRAAYPQGFFILGQKLSEAFSDNSFAPEQQGTLSISLIFKDAPSTPLTGVFVLEYQNILKLSPKGAVELDYDV